MTGPMTGPRIGAARTKGAVLVAVLVVVALLAGCSSDSGSDAEADAPRRTTTTVEAEDATSTTVADGSTTTAAPTSTAPPTSAGGGGSSSFTGSVDGQDGIDVSFTRSAAALTDVRAPGLELTCQPLEGGDAKTITVDVVIAEVPLGSGGLVEHTDADAPYEPTLSGSFTPDGAFAGAISLSGQRDGYACGGEFTFLAAP